MDDSKNEYANQLQKTNELQVCATIIITIAVSHFKKTFIGLQLDVLQAQFYNKLMPAVFNSLQVDSNSKFY